VFTSNELNKEIDLEKGEPLDKSKVDIGKETIRFKYYEKGYLYANIIPQIDSDPDTLEARVIISIHEAQRAHIESIEIVGTDSEEYILDRLYELKEGEIFNLSKLIQTRENILNTGYFKTEGTIWQLSQGSQPGLIKLVWVVEEERLRSIYFTAEISLSSITLKSDLQLVNFLGNGWDFSFLLELAGFERFKISTGVNTKWLFKYTPVSFSTSISYSVSNVVVNPLLIGLVYTTEGHLGIPAGYGLGSGGVDLNGDGVVDGFDSIPIDLNNDGVIDENDRVIPIDADGSGKFDSNELSQGVLAYTSHDFSFTSSIGYEFVRGIEAYFAFQTSISAAQNPRFGETSTVNIGGNPLKQFKLTPDQVDLIFTQDSVLYQELTTGWIATIGLTLGASFNFTKIGAVGYTGPLASEGWKTSFSVTPYFFGKQFMKYRTDFSTYYTILPWGEFSDPQLIFTVRLGIEMLGPLGESIISDENITPGDLVNFDGMTELRGFYNYNKNLSGYGKWIVQMEVRGPLPGLEQIIWMVPFFFDWGNIGYNPRGYSLEFGLASTPYYDPISGDLAVELGNESGHKFSFGFGFRVINILPIQLYFAWPFHITPEGIQRVVEMNSGQINETPWWPEFVISSFLYF
jgi:outer membrane protein assembly factor BamA